MKHYSVTITFGSFLEFAFEFRYWPVLMDIGRILDFTCKHSLTNTRIF
jgi:hypothetical protein